MICIKQRGGVFLCLECHNGQCTEKGKGMRTNAASIFQRKGDEDVLRYRTVQVVQYRNGAVPCVVVYCSKVCIREDRRCTVMYDFRGPGRQNCRLRNAYLLSRHFFEALYYMNQNYSLLSNASFVGG
jgi:hypothetical protein